VARLSSLVNPSEAEILMSSLKLKSSSISSSMMSSSSSPTDLGSLLSLAAVAANTAVAEAAETETLPPPPEPGLDSLLLLPNWLSTVETAVAAAADLWLFFPRISPSRSIESSFLGGRLMGARFAAPPLPLPCFDGDPARDPPPPPNGGKSPKKEEEPLDDAIIRGSNGGEEEDDDDDEPIDDVCALLTDAVVEDCLSIAAGFCECGLVVEICSLFGLTTDVVVVAAGVALLPVCGL